jgi:hypothetical protein
MPDANIVGVDRAAVWNMREHIEERAVLWRVLAAKNEQIETSCKGFIPGDRIQDKQQRAF